MIKYLLKFIKKEHLDYLLFQGLYMNAAGYYPAMGYKENDNQNDVYEGLSSFPFRDVPMQEKTIQERLDEAKTEFDKFCACAPVIGYNEYKGRHRPIWCCTGIEEIDIINGVFTIESKILWDFFKSECQNGCAVLIDYIRFMELIKNNPDEYEMIYGYVDYRNIHKIRGNFTDSGVWWDAIFNKRDDLSYQKEFRIAMCRNCDENLEDVVIDHLKMQTLNKDNPYIAYEYKLPNIQSAVVRIYSITELQQDDKCIYFDLSNVNNNEAGMSQLISCNRESTKAKHNNNTQTDLTRVY